MTNIKRIYLIVSYSAILLSLIIFRESIRLTYASIVFLLIPLTSIPRRYKSPIRYVLSSYKYNGNQKELEQTNPKAKENVKAAYIDYIKGLPYLYPVFLPFVFFFSDITKFICLCLILLIGFFAAFIYCFKTSSRELEQSKKKMNEELERQKRNEELGKFK